MFSRLGKIWEEFETFLENKQISKMRKKHLGDQIVINSYVYMFFNCDQSNPVWKIWEEFETFLENKRISKMKKKHL